MTVTDDAGSGNGTGFTFLLVRAVWSRRVCSSLLTSASAGLTSQQGTHDYSNLALLTLGARNIIDKRVPAHFAIVSNPLAHSWKSALVLGESGATVPASPDFLLLVFFNLLSQELSRWLTFAADCWGKIL